MKNFALIVLLLVFATNLHAGSIRATAAPPLSRTTIATDWRGAYYGGVMSQGSMQVRVFDVNGGRHS